MYCEADLPVSYSNGLIDGLLLTTADAIGPDEDDEAMAAGEGW